MMTTSMDHGNDLVTNMQVMGKTAEIRRLSSASGLEQFDHLNNNRGSDPMCVSTGENDGVGID